MHVDPERRYPSVHDFGRQLWSFGSQLGRGVWKKYYFETPQAARPRKDAHRSTTGIPLVLQIAGGKAPFAAPTAPAHYDGPTSSKTTTTIDDPAARADALADLGAPTISIAESSIQPVSDMAAAHVARSTARSRHRRPVIGVVAGLTIGVIAGTAALLATRHPAPRSRSSGALAVPSANRLPAEEISPPASPAAAPPAQVTAAPLNDAQPVADRNTPTAPDKPPRIKRRGRDHSRRTSPKRVEWGTDPFGNPIPPP